MNEFETAMVNEPSVFEPLKFYCNCIILSELLIKVCVCMYFRLFQPKMLEIHSFYYLLLSDILYHTQHWSDK